MTHVTETDDALPWTTSSAPRHRWQDTPSRGGRRATGRAAPAARRDADRGAHAAAAPPSPAGASVGNLASTHWNRILYVDLLNPTETIMPSASCTTTANPRATSSDRAAKLRLRMAFRSPVAILVLIQFALALLILLVLHAIPVQDVGEDVGGSGRASAPADTRPEGA